MGSIRTLLAISVLVTHSDSIFGLELLNGDMAITCFFMISGFLMALILQEKYASKRRFYVNRALRIYPPYYAALLLSVVIFASLGSERHDPVGFIAKVWSWDLTSALVLAALSNLTLIGIDLTRYISFDDFLLQVPAFLYKKGSGGHNMLFVPQAWTLAIELQFYLLAPFLVRLRSLQILGLAVAFFLFRDLVNDWFAARGWTVDSSALFPMVFGYFLMGVLAYRLYRRYRDLRLSARQRRWMQGGGVALALALVVGGRVVIYELDLAADVFYLLFALNLPLLFEFSAGKRWDAWFGEFSYPVYLFHFVAAQTIYMTALPEQWIGEATLLSTLLLSAGYIHLIDRPIQRLRARIAAGASARPERRIVEVPAR